jgi:uncharacterized protein YbjT (DUF2867 family)
MKAILIGATGLIGTELLKQLLADPDFESVKVVARKSTGVKAAQLEEVLVDFDNLETSSDVLKGDVLFSTLGTTIKTAGSKERQYEIDYDMQFNSAKFARENGVNKLVLLSSAGANATSSIFYSKMKGELDEAVEKLGFENVAIIRPSMLVGNRKEFRLSEKIFTPLMYAFTWIPGLRNYRPIKDNIVAKAMVNAAKNQQDVYKIYELGTIFKLAGT